MKNNVKQHINIKETLYNNTYRINFVRLRDYRAYYVTITCLCHVVKIVNVLIITFSELRLCYALSDLRVLTDSGRSVAL